METESENLPETNISTIKIFTDSFYEKTDNDSDRISKHDFLSDYKSYYKLKNMSWLGILNDIKRLSLNYHRQKKLLTN